MHDNVVLGGPVWWFALVLLIGASLLGLFVLFDSIFVRRPAFDSLREPRWSYTALQATFLVLLLAAQFPWTPRLIGGAAVIIAPFSIAQALGYLLRAVYPRAQDPELPERAADETDG